MIAPDDDDRVVPHAGFFQRLDHVADLRVGIADAGVVTMQQGAGEFLSNRARLGDTVSSAEFEGGMKSGCCPVLGGFGLSCQLDIGRVVHVPVFLGGDKVQVWFGQSQGQEEGLVAFLGHVILQGGNGQLRIKAVLVGMVCHVG